jgi:O-antigen/teichoic acid export membrane protein
MLRSEGLAASDPRHGLKHVASQAGWAGSIRIVGLTMNFGLAVFVARLTGPRGLGLLVVGIALAGAFSLVCGIGLAQGAVRYIAASQARGAVNESVGLLFFATGVVAALGLTLGLGLYAVLPKLLAGHVSVDSIHAVRVVALVLPLVALGDVWRGCLRGLDEIRTAQTLEDIALPVGTAAALSIMALAGHANAPNALKALTASYALCAVLSLAMVARAERRLKVRPIFRPATWLRFSIPVGCNAALLYCVGWGSQLILGWLRNSSEVGLYASASRLAALVVLPIVAVNTIFLPTIAGLHAIGNRASLQSLYARLTLIETIGGCVIAIALVVVGRFGLALFGSSFSGSYHILLILLGGYLINAATGSSGAVLMMTGRTGWLVIDTAVAGILTLVLSLSLIPRLGAVGAAVSAALSMAIMTLLQMIQVRLLLGFRAYAWREPFRSIQTKVLRGSRMSPEPGLAREDEVARDRLVASRRPKSR